MSFLNLFGSEQKTDQTAYNQQVGASSGSVGIGAGASGNLVSVTSSDPQVAEAALAANVVTSKAAIDSAGGVAALSISAQNDLVARFSQALSRSYQASTDFASASLTQAIDAEHSATTQTLNLVAALTEKTQEIQAQNSPGSAALAVQQTQAKGQFSTVLIVGAALVILALMGK